MNIKQNILLLTILVFIAILNIASISNKSITFDEASHWDYGKQILAGNSDRASDSKMPFTALNAIPFKLGNYISYNYGRTTLSDFFESIFAARIVTIFFSLLLALYIFLWAKELYGLRSAFFSIILYALSPNFIAHSRLVTTDLYAACTITIASYYFWKLNQKLSLKTMFLSSLSFAVSQLAKYTSLYLLLIFPVISIIKYVLINPAQTFKNYMKNSVKYILVFTLITVLIVNAGFLFNKIAMPLHEYNFKSNLFRNIYKSDILTKMRIPLSYPFVEGIDWVKSIERTRAYTYLFNKLEKKPKVIPGYYFFIIFYKIPIAVQIIFIWSIYAYIRRKNKFNFFNNELFLFVPVLFFTIYFNFFYRCQIGIRYFLVVMPFLYIFCGHLVKADEDLSSKNKRIFIFLFLWISISVLGFFPHYISYTNEFLLTKKNAYKIMADSNLSWGQNRPYIEKYQDEYPNTLLNPEPPFSGKVIIDINDLVGITGVFDETRADKYKFIRDNFEPIEHVAHSHLVFDISDNSKN